MMLPEDILDLCRELIRAAVGTRANLDDVQVLNHHQQYWVLLARLSHPDRQLIVKLAGENAPLASDFERTAALHRLLRAQTTLNIAEVLAADTSRLEYPWRYLIKTYIEGQEWRDVQPRLDEAQQRHAYAQIGNAVAQIHSVRFPQFGELDSTAFPSDGTDDYLQALQERAQKSIRQPHLLETFLTLLQSRSVLFAGVKGACLCHEDLHHRNLLFTQQSGEWELATVLDFEKAWVGHREIDLARLELWDGMVGDGFWSAYTPLHALDDSYTERRPIYQLLWCFEYAVNRERHLQDTNRLCEQLGLPPVTRFE